MDLIENLATQLGVDRNAAEGAVGSILGAIKQTAPAADAQEVTAKIPEAEGWIAKASAAGGGGDEGGGGGLLGAAGGLLGGAGGAGGLAGVAGGAGALGNITATLSKLGIGSDKLATIVPLVLQFLASRLGDGAVARLISDVPFLRDIAGGGAGSGGAGGLGGGIGGLMGGLLKP